MAEVQSIHPADLRIIENNLNVLHNDLDVIRSNVNTVDSNVKVCLLYTSPSPRN